MSLTSCSQHWIIEARAFPIAYTPFSHNFWALVTPEGTVADQIHGLAMDPVTGQTQAVGNSRHLLQVISDPSIVWSLQPGQPIAACTAGQETVIKSRWQCALDAIQPINALRLPYPDLWQHGYKPNSNTVFNTLGKIMGFADPAALLPTLAPGIRLVISQEIIERYCYDAATLLKTLFS